MTGLHLLLTYECNLRCAHCFVWGSPSQFGTMSAGVIENILDQAVQLGSVEWIYFEGGEPFLHYGLLVGGVQRAARLGFRVGIVTNAFWAADRELAMQRLRPFAGLVEDLSISTDRYHSDRDISRKAHTAGRAAETLGIPFDFIRVARPETGPAGGTGPGPGESALVFRGRAAERLAPRVLHKQADFFTECPHEDLSDPGRVHLDPFGNVHICQGIVLGNCLEQSLRDLFRGFRPDAHPITGPLLRGGPLELARTHGQDPTGQYADACHLCYRTRCALRSRFPASLAPDQMYGERPASFYDNVQKGPGS